MTECASSGVISRALIAPGSDTIAPNENEKRNTAEIEVGSRSSEKLSELSRLN